MSNKSSQNGFILVPILLIVLLVGAAGFVGWRMYSKSKEKALIGRPVTNPSQREPDSTSTIDTPTKVTTKDGQYFIYGAPAGQNNASPKKILITLHGTEGSAEKDYEIWKPLLNKQYALASFNWRIGGTNQVSSYSTPESMSVQIHDFLNTQGYNKNDVIVLEGFSRGSSNSYSVVAYDQASDSPLIDVVVSSSGGVQTDYFTSTTKSINSKAQDKIFTGVYWILSCGGKDPNPARDGCEAMNKSKVFVAEKGAIVLGILSDSNAGHGALTISQLGLTSQMFDLVEQKF